MPCSPIPLPPTSTNRLPPQESTLDVQLLSSGERTGAAGARLYCYEYELDSTRGRKRVLDAVTIFSSRLYILSATAKCGKEACGAGDEAAAGVRRRSRSGSALAGAAAAAAPKRSDCRSGNERA